MISKKDVVKKIEYFHEQYQRFAFDGKPFQWQLGFNAGIGAVVDQLMKQIFPIPIGENGEGRLYRHIESGVEYRLICIGNEQATKPEYIPTVAYVRTSDGVIFMRPKNEFFEKFKKA